MKAGTPGFVGGRLREAREARGLSGMSLSEILGVSRQAISQYESGVQSPRPEIMEKLPGLLNLPLQFFFRSMPASREHSAVFYRSMSAATKMARLRAERRLGWFKNIAFYVRRFVQLPAVNFPPALTVRDPASITNEMIEAKASEARRFWKLGNGAISDLLLLLENNGALATRGELATEYLDAFSQWLREEETPYLFLGDDKLSAARSRFDAAHELAHLLLHRGLSPEQIQRPEIHRLVENQAHLFAGAFLLPAETFAADFEGANLEVLRLLKAKWKVSIGMMVMRAEQLNFISDQQAQRLWRSYSRRGWRSHEPLDNEIPLERPRVLRRAIELLVDSGVQSKADILSRLPYSGQDIEELAGLEPGYLHPTQPTVRLLQFPGADSSTQVSEAPSDGGIIRFPHERARM